MPEKRDKREGKGPFSEKLNLLPTITLLLFCCYARFSENTSKVSVNKLLKIVVWQNIFHPETTQSLLFLLLFVSFSFLLYNL